MPFVDSQLVVWLWVDFRLKSWRRGSAGWAGAKGEAVLRDGKDDTIEQFYHPGVRESLAFHPRSTSKMAWLQLSEESKVCIISCLKPVAQTSTNNGNRSESPVSSISPESPSISTIASDVTSGKKF